MVVWRSRKWPLHVALMAIALSAQASPSFAAPAIAEPAAGARSVDGQQPAPKPIEQSPMKEAAEPAVPATRCDLLAGASHAGDCTAGEIDREIDTIFPARQEQAPAGSTIGRVPRPYDDEDDGDSSGYPGRRQRRSVARRSLLSLALAVTPTIAPAPVQGANRPVGDHSIDLFRQGLRRYLEHDYGPACALFRVGLEVGRRPSANGRAAYYDGECLLRAKREGEAYWMFQRSYAFGPETPQGQASFWRARGMEGDASIRVENRSVRPTSRFEFVYPYEPSPGLRTWTLDEAGRWHERYPDGEVAKVFDRTHRGFVGCSGSIAALGSSPTFEVFVPDLGCPGMDVLFRDGGLRWRSLGPMLDIS